MRHSIAKVNIRISAKGGMDGIDLQHEASRLFWNNLQPKIEELFDRLSDENATQMIDHLTIDLGNISGADWAAQFCAQLLEALQMALQSLEKPAENEATNPVFEENPDTDRAFRISGEQRQPVQWRLFDTWLHFLKTGNLPAAATLPADEAEWRQVVLETLASETRAEQQLLHLLRQHPNVARRLAIQFEEVFLARIAAVLNRQALERLPLLRAQLHAIFAALSKGIPESFDNAKWQQRIQVMYSAPEFWQSYFFSVAASDRKNRSAGQAATLPFEQFVQALPAREVQSLQAAWQQVVPHPKSGGARQARRKLPTLHPELLKAMSEAFGAAPGTADMPLLEKSDLSGHTHPVQDSDAPVRDAFVSEPAANTPSELIPPPLYVQWAGVVLTHAFLPVFFKTLDLLDDQKQFRSAKAQQKAVHAIQFLASGEEQLPEFRLVLPKILCGLQPDHPIERAIELTDLEKAEADTLLRSLLSHWNALGSASPAGLREGFFDRTGKLSKGRNGLLLQVESRTLDIMLQRLPWGISLIRLPWTKDMLQVDWTY